MGFPGGSDGKVSTCNAGDLGSIPELGRYPGEEIGYPLQYFGLENTIHEVAKSLKQLSNFLFHVHCTTWEIEPIVYNNCK